MMRRLSVVLSLVVLSIGFVVTPARAQDERCFPETGFCISGVIRRYWEANGGLAVFGYPTTALAIETNDDGFTGPTQWFERDRLEDHGPTGVLAGRLGAQRLAMQGRPWETFPRVTGAAQGCLFFVETGHSLCPPFRAYWEQNGGLMRFGYPITEQVTERNDVGFFGVMQWFERRRMESHPQNQPPYHVLLGLLGNEVRASNPPPPPPQPTATTPPQQPSPTPSPPAPSFNNCQADPNASLAPNWPVRIIGINKQTETVTLRNVSQAPVDLAGWRVCSIAGNQEHLGIGGSLAPGESRGFTHSGGNIWLNADSDPGALCKRLSPKGDSFALALHQSVHPSSMASLLPPCHEHECS